MIQLFKKNDISHVLILLPYTVLLRLYSIFYPTLYTSSPSDGILNNWIFNKLLTSPISQSLAGILLVYLQAVILNVLINRNKLLSVPAAVPGLMYVIFASFLIEFQGLTPAIIGNTFVLISCLGAFSVYKKNIATTQIFNSSLFLGIAALWYFPYIVLIIAQFLIIASLRNFKIKERFQFILGAGTIYWIMASSLYYAEKMNFITYTKMELPGSVGVFTPWDLSNLLTVIAIFLFILFAGLNYYNYMKRKGIEVRKKVNYLYWNLFLAVISLFIFKGAGKDILFMYTFPISAFFSMSILSIKNNSLAELLHIILLIGLVYSQFGLLVS